MKKFTAGMILSAALIATVTIIWLLLNEHTQGIIIGLVVGFLGLALGIVLALAVVGILLLKRLHWSINEGARQMPTPIIMGGPWNGPPALPAPQGQGQPMRAPRGWQILGAEDGEQAE